MIKRQSCKADADDATLIERMGWRLKDDGVVKNQ
jgi:hypothetical protein